MTTLVARPVETAWYRVVTLDPRGRELCTDTIGSCCWHRWQQRHGHILLPPHTTTVIVRGPHCRFRVTRLAEATDDERRCDECAPTEGVF